ncbi:MAG: NUDIX hydrolase [Mangrovibacterium sp.]
MNNSGVFTLETIRKKLNQTLLGEIAHKKMLPKHRSIKVSNNEKANAKHSAVLILLYSENNQLYTYLIERSTNMKHHPGEIGFPGGAIEEHEDIISAAIRESEEEIGLKKNQSVVIRDLSPIYVPASKFIIHPFVAWTEQKNFIITSPDEINRIIRFPIHDFLNDNKVTQTKVKVGNEYLDVPAYVSDYNIIWGATAMILSELMELLKQ